MLKLRPELQHLEYACRCHRNINCVPKIELDGGQELVLDNVNTVLVGQAQQT